MTAATKPVRSDEAARLRQQKKLMPWLFVLPTLVVILAVTVFPTIYSLGLSLFKWEATLKARPFIGLGNYARLAGDARFWHAALVTAIIVVGGVVLELVLGFAFAQFLSADGRSHRLIVTLMLLPVMVMPVVVGYTWRLLWDTQYGPINQIIGWIIGKPFQFTWLAQPPSAILAILITEIWQWTPFMFLIFYAGLATLDIEIFDAAKIDGASGWSLIRHLTIPLMKPIIVVAVLIRALDAIKAFDLIFTLTNGGPGTSTETLAFYIYKVGFQFFRLGYAAAMSFVLLIFLSVLLTYLMRYLRAVWQ
jgi:multiple sugar transport system permease protein